MRLSYDLADYQRSLDAARRALTIEPGHIPARLAEASTLVSLHDFPRRVRPPTRYWPTTPASPLP